MRLAFGGLIAAALLALAGTVVEAQPDKKKTDKKKTDKKAAKHPRLKKETPAGKRHKLSLGTLFLPDTMPKDGDVPILFNFKGEPWIAEVAAARANIAVVAYHNDGLSGVYVQLFRDKKRFGQLLAEAEKKAGRKFTRVALSGWSAGYGALQMILAEKDYYAKVRWAILMDGMHTGYVKGNKVNPAQMTTFLAFAKDAAAGKKQFLITHTKIKPGGYASTTETADYLLSEVGVKRTKHTGKGLFGLPQETDGEKGGLHVFGCAGATGDDHYDHPHALPSLVALLDQSRK